MAFYLPNIAKNRSTSRRFAGLLTFNKIEKIIHTRQLIIITGLSGAGKRTASKSLEDLGFYCVDNLPPFLLTDLLQGMEEGDSKDVALVLDIRSADFVSNFSAVWDQVTRSAYSGTLLFLEANEQVLLQRFSAMRRKHPLAKGAAVRDGIIQERGKLSHVKKQADAIIDTSTLTPHELRAQIAKRFTSDDNGAWLQINVMSFGFKYGVPAEADLVFDVRFLPNPYFVEGLKKHTGLNPEVASYVMDNSVTMEFLDRMKPLLEFLIPQYQQEGKANLTIAIGCTGGRHRSVTIAEELKKVTPSSQGLISIHHRDYQR